MTHRLDALENKRKKRNAFLIPFLAAAAALFLPPSSSRGAEPFVPIIRFAREAADLYQQPSVDARISIELESGARLTLVDQEGDWFLARLPNDRVGWIQGKFLAGRPPAPTPGEAEPESEPVAAAAPAEPPEPAMTEAVPEGLYTVEVTVDSGRIRSAPNLEAPVQLGVSRGEKAVVLETEGVWRRIRLADGRTGWGHRMLFTQIDSEPEMPTAGPESEEIGPDDGGAESEPRVEKPVDEKILQAISATAEEAGAETVTFQLGGFYPPETFVIEEGDPKVVCDFMGVKAGETLKRRIAVNGDMVQRIRVGVHDAPALKVRAVVDLARDKTYSVEQIFIKGKDQYILTFKTTGPSD